MDRYGLIFVEPGRVEVRPLPAREMGPDEVFVRTIVSAISPGTEMLVYRGQWPADLPIDDSIAALAGRFSYPLTYGYSCVGCVEAVGAAVEPSWLGRTVFAFHPHASQFCAQPGSLIPLPDSLAPDIAGMLPNMETAVSFVMDGRPMIGDIVAVLGQGVVGLLTTALLGRMPLGDLITADTVAARRVVSRELGAGTSIDPTAEDADSVFSSLIQGQGQYPGADLVYELSGNPAALDRAISWAGFGARIVVGSWYGAKRADLDLGGRFHRARLRIVSSQVSNLDPDLTGRWTKARRMTLAVRMLERINPVRLITHRIPFSRAAEGYELLDRHPEEAIQVIFTYEDFS